MSNFLKTAFNWLTSAVALIVLAIVIGIVSWPMVWNGLHLVSIFWWSVGGFIGAWEVGLKVFTGKTLTQHVRDNHKLQPLAFWLMNGVWVYFAITLFFHFIKPVVLGST